MKNKIEYVFIRIKIIMNVILNTRMPFLFTKENTFSQETKQAVALNKGDSYSRLEEPLPPLRGREGDFLFYFLCPNFHKVIKLQNPIQSEQNTYLLPFLHLEYSERNLQIYLNPGEKEKTGQATTPPNKTN